MDTTQTSVFDSHYNYNMIVGQDFLQRAGIRLNFKFGYMEWLEQRVAMKATVNVVHSRTIDEHEFLFDDEEVDQTSYTSEIKDAKYEAILAEEVSEQ
eukprot:9424528-Ditylum_brightwellii.AAC.1